MISDTKIINSNLYKNDYVNYVISLNYPDKLLKQLSEKHRLNPILFNGIDGKKCSDDIIKHNFTTFYRYFGPKGSIGCALSHINVWKTFLKTNKKCKIAFEFVDWAESLANLKIGSAQLYLLNLKYNLYNLDSKSLINQPLEKGAAMMLAFKDGI